MALEDVVARIAPVPIRVEPAVAELIELKQPQVTSKKSADSSSTPSPKHEPGNCAR
jgi:hypothetical protein